MKTIDLTTPAAALAYLRTLPADQSISLPGPMESTAEGDAVRIITGYANANQWAAMQRQWDWMAGDLVREVLDYVEAPEGTLEDIVAQNDESAMDDYDASPSRIA